MYWVEFGLGIARGKDVLVARESLQPIGQVLSHARRTGNRTEPTAAELEAFRRRSVDQFLAQRAPQLEMDRLDGFLERFE